MLNCPLLVWWREYGFPFEADANGYPRIGQVIVHLRKQRTKRDGEAVAGAFGGVVGVVVRQRHDLQLAVQSPQKTLRGTKQWSFQARCLASQSPSVSPRLTSPCNPRHHLL